jgi:hypothetical protein
VIEQRSLYGKIANDAVSAVWLHRRSLQSQDALADDADLKEHRAAVSALWQHFMLGESI